MQQEQRHGSGGYDQQPEISPDDRDHEERQGVEISSAHRAYDLDESPHQRRFPTLNKFIDIEVSYKASGIGVLLEKVKRPYYEKYKYG